MEQILTGLRQHRCVNRPSWRPRWPCKLNAYVRPLTTLVENIRTLKSSRSPTRLNPDSRVISSFPGLGTVLGARILGEIGDDHTRFGTARGLKAFAGTAPITRSSGTKTLITMRVVRNKRLGQAAYLWSLPLLAHSPGGRAHYDRRASGDSLSAASRHLADRGLGMLHHCLSTGQTYNEAKAFPPSAHPSATSGSPIAHQAYQEAEAPTTASDDRSHALTP